MGKGCFNGVLDQTKYSSPLPVIGLYIVAGSVVCMLFMLFDITSAFRHRKSRWIPCRLFSLNSLTLTLLSICSKISVDLTTPMPGVYDQLVKLTGTTLLCVSMAFFHPSLGDMSDYECLTNMIALSILIITVIVNICIQIYTGVIYLFKTEHIIVMACMSVLLYMLFYSRTIINKGKNISLDFNKDIMKKQEGSLLQRLKLCYLYSIKSNPQLATCRDEIHAFVILGTSVSFGVLLQAVYRSVVMKQIKSCPGSSDYDWSMWMIMIFQILTSLLGCFALSFRWFNFGNSFNVDGCCKEQDEVLELIIKNPVLGASLWFIICSYFQQVLFCVILSPLITCMFLMFCLTKGFCGCCLWWRSRRVRNTPLTEYHHLVGRDYDQVERWIVLKAVSDMERWKEVSRAKGAENLSQLLSRINPSLEQFYGLYPDETGVEISSLSMALIVKIATVSLPFNLSQPLEHSFGEAKEIIDFIETRYYSATRKTKMTTELAKAVLLGKGFEVLLPKLIGNSENRAQFESLSELDRALFILRGLANTMQSDLVGRQVGYITDVINRWEYQSIQDLCNYIEQMFVDMLHSVLVRFPQVVFTEVTGSSAEEFEERVSRHLKLLWQIEMLENQVMWVYPAVEGISSLITATVPHDSQGSVGIGGSSSSHDEGSELQARASLSDDPEDSSAVGIDVSPTVDAPSSLEQAELQVTEIVVIEVEP